MSNTYQQVNIFLINGKIVIAYDNKYGPVHQSILYEFQQGTRPFINANLIDDQKALIPKQNILYITVNNKF
ncbi:hypothetical protein [Faecalitalea cylindroides]|uniref:hypothetical protein n=1 Tax=Faecalitalea cylindroides TaxID=39483 RepID=UPI0039F5AA96